MDTKLIASVALFRELYNEQRDIYDVISALLKAAIVFDKKLAFNVTEATQSLESVFGFQLPEAVVASTLRNRLKNKEQVVTYDQGVYAVAPDKVPDIHFLDQELNATRETQKWIANELAEYSKSHSKRKLSDADRESLFESFGAFLLNEDIPAEHQTLISSFIVEKQSIEKFHASINAVREGFVLYDGVRYSSDLSKLGSWRSDLVIYLDTEHLFNAAGLNGELYEQLFDDLYRLVRDANQASKKSIRLRYFSESEAEVENFFHVAELIVRGQANLDPSKTAMVAIVSGSKTVADVIEKKASLFAALERRRIRREARGEFYDEPGFVIESAALVEQLRMEDKEKQREFDESACLNALKLFTKINVFREGKNAGPFDDIGYVLLTGKGLTRYLAFHPSIRGNGNSVPFATDLEFITNRLWFTLQKGLASDGSPPRSLDAIAKAQVVLSSQINNSVSKHYSRLHARLASGKMTVEEAQYMHHELRQLATSPEEITSESVDRRVEILSYDDFETHLREKSRLEKAAREGKQAQQELAAIRSSEAEAHARRGARMATIKVGLMSIGLVLVFGAAIVGLMYFLNELRSEADTPLSLLGLALSLGAVVYPLLKIKSVKSWLGSKYEKWSKL